MSVEKSLFGKTKDGREVYSFCITNSNDMSICVISFGAILKNVLIPVDGKKDVVLGYDNLEEYLINESCFGATIGPVCNRTEKGTFELDGKVFNLAVNDRGINNLHTDLENGFHKRVWDFKEIQNGVIFSLKKKNMEMGHPGNIDVSVTYTLTDDNEIVIEYHGESDSKTILNMTNHSYFNLQGVSSSSILDTDLTINGDKLVEIREDAIPTGSLKEVKNTPFDFTKSKLISEDISDEEDDQIRIAGGYDHNYCINEWKNDGHLLFAASAKDSKSGISMDTYTTMPGVQFYSGNFIGENMGKEGFANGKRKGFCLETQYFPNSAADTRFFRPICEPGRDYNEKTVYKFSW